MDKVEQLKEELLAINVGCSHRVRKLSKGPKRYFTLTGEGTHSTFYGKVLPVVKKVYPDASPTSGGFYGTCFRVVVSEY